jgi:hypothetical protein
MDSVLPGQYFFGVLCCLMMVLYQDAEHQIPIQHAGSDNECSATCVT